jgi:hypothetical protein
LPLTGGPDSGSVQIKLDLIYITPAPAFAGLDRFHDWVFRSVEVLCRVLVLRGIAAAHLAADQALSQVNPSVSKFVALAAYSFGRFHGFNLIHVRALFHMYSS